MSTKHKGGRKRQSCSLFADDRDDCLEELGWERTFGSLPWNGNCMDCGARFIHCEYCCGCRWDIYYQLECDKEKLHELLVLFYEGQDECVNDLCRINSSSSSYWEYLESLECEDYFYFGQDVVNWLLDQVRRKNQRTSTLADFVDEKRLESQAVEYCPHTDEQILQEGSADNTESGQRGSELSLSDWEMLD